MAQSFREFARHDRAAAILLLTEMAKNGETERQRAAAGELLMGELARLALGRTRDYDA